MLWTIIILGNHSDIFASTDCLNVADLPKELVTFPIRFATDFLPSQEGSCKSDLPLCSHYQLWSFNLHRLCPLQAFQASPWICVREHCKWGPCDCSSMATALSSSSTTAWKCQELTNGSNRSQYSVSYSIWDTRVLVVYRCNE